MSVRPIPYHAAAARHAPGALARRWLRQGKLWLLPLLLSDFGREIVSHKYDAFVTDRAYDARPSGREGALATVVEWLIQRQSIHVGLRQRLALVTEMSAETVRDEWARGTPTVRLASGPCGLARDLRQLWQALDAPQGRLELLGLDLDASGEVLPAVEARARGLAMPLRTTRLDLLDHAALRAAVGEPLPLFLSIGLTVWLDEEALARFLAGLHAVIQPGGQLLIDNFRAHGSSRFARDLEMVTHYHAAEQFEGRLAAAGFAVTGRRETANRINVLYRCTRL